MVSGAFCCWIVHKNTFNPGSSGPANLETSTMKEQIIFLCYNSQPLSPGLVFHIIAGNDSKK